LEYVFTTLMLIWV